MSDNKAYQNDEVETTYFGGEEPTVTSVAPPPYQADGQPEYTEIKVEQANGTEKQDLYENAAVSEQRPLATKPYAGMGKEDLLRFSDTPFWNRFRLACLIIFWVGWLALLGAVIGLTIVAPRCSSPPEPTWWEKSTLYQIYVRSFRDSDGDGNGDIQGIIEKLDYFSDINVKGIILSSISESQDDKDFGYEITNYEDVNPMFGQLSDFDTLVEAAHNKSLKVIIDFVPNHSGTDHEWFASSSANASRDNSYWNYYVWADCGQDGSQLPNNWLSMYGDAVPAWTYNSDRGQCYLHQGYDSQPDLNLRSSQVKEELENILRFWLGKGVDGFRVMTTSLLFEDSDLRDEDPCAGEEVDAYDCRKHEHTRDLPEIHDIIARWRSVLSEAEEGENTKVLITDADTTDVEVIKYYGTFGRVTESLPNNYLLRDTSNQVNSLIERIENFTSMLPANATASWLLGSQDRSRLGTDDDENDSMLKALTVLQMTLPGIPIVYYGDELGMRNGMQDDNIKASRTLMQWNNGTNAGFSEPESNSPWIELNPDYVDRNTEKRESGSVNAVFRQLAQLRANEESMKIGNFDVIDVGDSSVFIYVREIEGHDRFLIAVNLSGDDKDEFNVARERDIVPNRPDVVMTTAEDSDLTPEERGDLRSLSLKPYESAIFVWEYSR